MMHRPVPFRWFSPYALQRVCLAPLLGLVLNSALPPCSAAVFINEFVADNGIGLRPAGGTPADWIELRNDAAQPVDLSGWYLTDQRSSPMKWRVPDGTSIPADGYLVVFADGSPVAWTNSELHASFSLSKDGEYLALFGPDGTTVADEFSPVFPPQFQDISYGRGVVRERELLGSGSPVLYRVPNAEGDASWTNGLAPLGFSGARQAFKVQYCEMNTPIWNIDSAETMLAESSYWNSDRAYPLTGDYETLNFLGASGPGAFADDMPFPGHASVSEDREHFALKAEGAIYVPSAGLWTFAVGSDDGFRLRIAGHDQDFVAEYATGRSFDWTLATFNFPVAGIYDLSLVFFEAGGAAGLELAAAAGFQSGFSPDVFRLVGDPASGVLHAGAIGALVGTDVSQAMNGKNAHLDARWEFVVKEVPAANDAVLLQVRCADGFSASLNGQPITAFNSPGTIDWNSVATVRRPVEEVLQWQEYSVPAALLVVGTNTLDIAALNDSATDPEFLIEAKLVWRPEQSFAAYFKVPTPGRANATSYTAPTPLVNVDEPRGFKTNAFAATLSCSAPGAEIRYTLDGSAPGTNSPLYSGPIAISRTTTLRAAVVDPETVMQNVTTVTWLFLEDILRQGTVPPPGWPVSRQVNNHVMEYGLRSAIVQADPLRLRQGMTNIPSISLVTDLSNLFSPQKGIYVNPGNDGLQWERPVSVEIIDPLRGPSAEFHINAGLRIRGAYSRSSENPKHSFRLFFRSEYGDGKLRFPLFDEEGAEEYDKVDLRTSQNYSWAFENSDNDTFVREVFSRDAQRDMGMPYTRSRYYHLYLNGLYWGLYQTQERGDADFAETYLGGRNEEWDCIKTTQPGYTTTASDGNFDAFYALHTLAVVQGFTGSYANNYYRVKGLNPDGTPNPAYPVYLDEDNLIIYMLSAYYAGDPDSPVSIWGGMPNNMYAVFNRLTPSGFQWLRHDAEHSLGAHPGYQVDCDTTTAGSGLTAQYQFNPAILHQRLCEHPEYRRRFADLVQKHLYGDGALTPTNSRRRFADRMQEIDSAIIGESARWGRGKTRDATWLPACNSVLNSYFPYRREIIMDQFRARGWFPRVDAPLFSAYNESLPPGQNLRISAKSTFYYTTNGIDPRMPNGEIEPTAIKVTGTVEPPPARALVARGATWRYFDLGAEPAAVGKLAWTSPDYPDSAWGQGPAILGFPGSDPSNAVATRTRRYVSGSSGPQVTTTYFRHNFSLDNTNGLVRFRFELLRDDGVIIYLNGSEVLRDNMGSGLFGYDSPSATCAGSTDQTTYRTLYADGAQLLREGANTLAVEVHQCNETSSDIYLDVSLTALPDDASVVAQLPVNSGFTLKARSFDGAEWSALSETYVKPQLPPADYSKLRVTELMYAPPLPEGQTNYTTDDFAWVELQNVGQVPIDLEGVGFTTGIAYTFGFYVLAPGARVLLARNLEAFGTRYSTNDMVLVQWASGNLARGGERLTLTDPQGTNILSFEYSRTWYPETFNTGFTLVPIDVTAAEDLWSTASNWRPGRVLFGTPGMAEPPAFETMTVSGTNLVLKVSGLGQGTELWYSADLGNWVACDPAAWSLKGEYLTIDLAHATLRDLAHSFFQLREQR